MKDFRLGDTLSVKVIGPHQLYGLHNSLVNASDVDMIEIWNRGQFISRYYVHTLMDLKDGEGLMVDRDMGVQLDDTMVQELKGKLTQLIVDRYMVQADKDIRMKQRKNIKDIVDSK